jgi:putative transposase
MISSMAQSEFEVAELCGALDVSRSAYYSWKGEAPSRYRQQSRELEPLIKDIFLRHKRRYGARRISFELKEQGVSCSRAKARKIMGQMGLVAIQPKSFKPRTTESRHKLGYSPNLLIKGIDLNGINQVWVGDITYIPMRNQFAYLAMLMDLFSRKIVGWELDLNMEASLVKAALKKAIRSRQPRPGLIHHTDRGGQYAATNYRQLLARAKMNQSMSRAGDCYDNAFMESCFGTIKTEMEITNYQSLKKARLEILAFTNYYNHNRRHSSIANLSPNRFELNLRP